MKEKMMSAEAVDYFADLAADKSCMLQVMDRCVHTSTQCSFQDCRIPSLEVLMPPLTGGHSAYFTLV